MNISKNINCLHEFQKGLEMLLLENSKEIIERLTDIAISYDQFSPDFLQMIIRYFNKVYLKNISKKFFFNVFLFLWFADRTWRKNKN